MSGELTGRSLGVPAQVVSGPVFAEVRIADTMTMAPTLPPSTSPVEPATKIGIELPSGIRLTVDSGVDADALRPVLSVFAR